MSTLFINFKRVLAKWKSVYHCGEKPNKNPNTYSLHSNITSKCFFSAILIILLKKKPELSLTNQFSWVLDIHLCTAISRCDKLYPFLFNTSIQIDWCQRFPVKLMEFANLTEKRGRCWQQLQIFFNHSIEEKDTESQFTTCFFNKINVKEGSVEGLNLEG